MLPDLSRRLRWTGLLYTAAVVTLVLTRTPLGSALFFLCITVMGGAFLTALAAVWNTAAAPRGLLITAFLFALAFRLPLAFAPVGPDNDMVRYLWDGRVQRLGYNPYAVVPADPAVVHTHTEQTSQMPSLRARTPYPPGAQLFFRLIVTLHESTLAMKLALVACDVLTILVLWQLLQTIGRSPWLALAYAWNPLVVLEVAHSGHIDALGALWIAASAWLLARRRTTLASLAFVVAVATKFLPIVLIPLYWRRIRLVDGVVAAGLLAGMYVWFAENRSLPRGAVPNVVAHNRFNGPVFKGIAAVAAPQVAAAAAVLLGCAAALWARRTLPVSDPAAWAWPMALALACAPVIYPWYLLYLTPFLWSRRTVPLLVWTLSVLLVYVVWAQARLGGRWILPIYIQILEYGVVLGSMALCARAERRRSGEVSLTG